MCVLTLRLKLTLKFFNYKNVVPKKKEFCFQKLTKSHHDFLGKIRGATPRNSALLGCVLHTQPSWC